MSDFTPSLWVSHSSISDYLQCPRSYYLKNVYKEPETGRKLALMQPPLALGQAVHAVLEVLADLPIAKRFERPLLDRYEESWSAVSGRRGGFTSQEEEETYKARGAEMLSRVMRSPGPFGCKALRIPKSSMLLEDLPSYHICPEENIVLCGKIDWLQYVEESDSVSIIDFKTGAKSERPGSLQLPIYLLLATNCQRRPVTGAAYWYLDRDDIPTPVELPDIETANRHVLEIARDIAWARRENRFPCAHPDGCRSCAPYEEILSGQAEHVYTDFSMRKEVYASALPTEEEEERPYLKAQSLLQK